MGIRGADSEHLFFAALSGRQGLDFQGLAVAWTDLSEARLAAYDALLPDAWTESRPAVLQAIGHLISVRDRIGDCLSELRRVLR